MRISRLPALALCLGIGGLAMFGGGHDAASAAVLDSAPAIASQCQLLPVASPSASPSDSPTASPTPSATPSPSPTDSPSASPSPSPSDSPSASPSATDSASVSSAALTDFVVAADPAPSDLCISVQATQNSFQAGQNATWAVEVWAPDGPVTGVTVYLTGNMAGEPPVFSAQCPGGNGGTSCYVGDLDTGVAAASDTMQAQITVPSGTAAATSVTLTGTANATPSLPTMPAAATAVTTTVAPAASSSASASASAAASSSAATSTAPGVSGQSTVTPAPGTASTVTLPGIGTIPGLAAPGVTAVTSPGSVSGLLPVITPGPSATSPASGFVTSPAADNAADAANDRSTGSTAVLVVSSATAEKLGVVVLLVLVAVALRMRTKTKILADRAARGAHNEPAPTRRFKPSALLHPGRPRGDAPKQD